MSVKHILVIDDEESLREIIRACLEDLGGWRVVLADSGQTGLTASQTTSFDAILLDISMPDMDGYEIFRQLQARAETRTVPVVLLTAKVLPEDRARFAQMGVAGLITKPFDPLDLCPQLARLLHWDDPAGL